MSTASAPIPLILSCPSCHKRHVDKGELATEPHHTHACQHCGAVWRPAIVDTVGVQFLPDFKNPQEPPPDLPDLPDLDAIDEEAESRAGKVILTREEALAMTSALRERAMLRGLLQSAVDKVSLMVAAIQSSQQENKTVFFTEGEARVVQEFVERATSVLGGRGHLVADVGDVSARAAVLRNIAERIDELTKRLYTVTYPYVDPYPDDEAHANVVAILSGSRDDITSALSYIMGDRWCAACDFEAEHGIVDVPHTVDRRVHDCADRTEQAREKERENFDKMIEEITDSVVESLPGQVAFLAACIDAVRTVPGLKTWLKVTTWVNDRTAAGVSGAVWLLERYAESLRFDVRLVRKILDGVAAGIPSRILAREAICYYLRSPWEKAAEKAE